MAIELTYAESVEVPAPIEAVFDYRLDFMNTSAYLPVARNVHRVDGGTDLGPGAEYRTDLSFTGEREVEVFLRVVAVDRPHRIVFDTGTPELNGRETSSFAPLPDGGTHVEFSIVMSLPDEARDRVPFLRERGRRSFRVELDLIRDIFAAKAAGTRTR